MNFMITAEWAILTHCLYGMKYITPDIEQYRLARWGCF